MPVSISQNEQVQSWEAQLPDDLKYGTFEKDFKVDGVHYEHGAWSNDGNWWLAWNTDQEFLAQISQIAF